MVDLNVATPPSFEPTIALPVTPLGKALVFLLRGIGKLPIATRGAVGASIGRLIGRIPFREQKIVVAQLALFQKHLAKPVTPSDVFAHVARVTMESVDLTPVLKNPDNHVRCEMWPTVETWLRDERPLVVLTGHFGNWDLLAAYAISRGVPITTIGREARNPGMQEALRWMRDAYGVETLWRSDKSALKRLISCLRERRVVAALIDQDTRVESIFTPFFGRDTRTPSSLVELGKKFDARFVYAFLHRNNDAAPGSPSFDLITGELPNQGTTEEILSAYHHQLERLVSLSPEQWVWFHKRWRSQRDGTTMSSRVYLQWLQDERAKNIRELPHHHHAMSIHT